jgi:hypothetical protein
MSSRINEDDNALLNGLEDAEVVNMEEYEEGGSQDQMPQGFNRGAQGSKLISTQQES